MKPHQSQLVPAENKFHRGNGDDGKHYWLSPPSLLAAVRAEFGEFFDPCPYPLPTGFDGLTCEWGAINYANIPFGSIIHQGKKKALLPGCVKQSKNGRRARLSCWSTPWTSGCS